MSTNEKMSFGGRWSDEKLDALSEYLHAYTTALKRTGFHLTYIDAFAGAGRNLVEEAGEDSLFDDAQITEDAQYRHGSPLIALENVPPFDSFVFIDQNEVSLKTLKGQVANTAPAKEGRIRFLCGDANEQLQGLTVKNWKAVRAVAFLDPFALHVSWKTIEQIAATQAIDMWLLFPAMAVNRMLTRSGEIPDAWATKLTKTFGSDDWKNYFYRPQERDLFGEAVVSKTPEIFKKLSDYITLRLHSVFAGVHKKPLILRNSTGAPLFLLCFACGNPKGADIATKIAQHIINKKNYGH